MHKLQSEKFGSQAELVFIFENRFRNANLHRLLLVTKWIINTYPKRFLFKYKTKVFW